MKKTVENWTSTEKLAHYQSPELYSEKKNSPKYDTLLGLLAFKLVFETEVYEMDTTNFFIVLKL